MEKKNILLGITASIAAYKAYDLIRHFRKKGHNVRCAVSRDAKWFVSRLILESLSGQTAVFDMFESPDKTEIEHISLADQADVILIAPATADVIAKISAGICDDILTCAVAASDCPVIFAPAMNDKMYANPIFRENARKLKALGYIFVDPIEGDLACGRSGMGHLAELKDITEQTERILTQGPRKRLA